MRKTSVLLVIVLGIVIRPAELVTFNNPGTVYLNENDDSGQTLWAFSATCYPSTNNYFIDIFGTKRFVISTTDHTVACETCSVTTNPDSGLFYWSGNTVYKKACSDTDCGNCPSCTTCSTSNGCFNGAATYYINVTCATTSYDNDDNGTSTLTVDVASETTTLTINQNVEESFPIAWLVSGVVLITFIVIVLVLIKFVCRLPRKVGCVKDARNERSHSYNTQGAQPNGRHVRRNLIGKYESISVDRNQAKTYEANRQVIDIQNRALGVDTNRCGITAEKSDCIQRYSALI